MTIRHLLTFLVASVALAFVAVACSSGGDQSPAAPSSAGEAAAAAAAPTSSGGFSVVAPYSLPTRDVAFSVALPAGTEGPVWVRIFGIDQWDFARSVELTAATDGRWTASVPLEEGALLRYRYDRADLTDFPSMEARREAPATALDTIWRIVHVAPELTEVRDTVAMWADARTAIPTGSVTGLVTDGRTGEPVMDAEVAVGGMHTATDFDGRYRLDGVAAGEHRVTIHRATGDYLSTAVPVTVKAGGTVDSPIQVVAARALTVQIQALLPADLPPGAAIKIYGNAWQTGGNFYQAPGQPEGLLLPVASPVRGYEGERVLLSLDLYEGQSITYRYTLAGPSRSRELRLDGDQTPRSFIASRSARVRVDQIEAFRPLDAVEVVLRVRVPDNTPAGVPVQLSTGPSFWLTADDSGAWTTVLYGRPGETINYALRLGDGLEVGADASPDALDGQRTIEVPGADTSYAVTVTDWVGLPGVVALPEGELSTVRFRVSVAAGTTEGSTLRVVGQGALSDGIELIPAASDPTLFEGTAMLPSGRYDYEIWRDDGDAEPAISSSFRELNVTLAEHTVNDWVSAWSGEDSLLAPRDLPFAGGFYLPDFWSPGFAALTAPAFDAIEAASGGLVALSSVWGYGQVLPDPIVEPRSLRAPSVATPLEALREQGRLARRSELPVVLAPQFNMEQTIGASESLLQPKSQQWIDGWLREAERVWLWNAEVADTIGADLLLLPGPTFHVFDQPDWFPSQQSFEEFDRALVTLIGQVRERYDGRLLVSGGQTRMTAPGVADFVGVTTFDIGDPPLDPDASVEQWRVSYEARFAERLDPIHDAWDRPVFVYQLRVPSRPTPGDPTGEYAQARQLEGMFQALATRPWVAGALSWSYEMFDAPSFVSDGLRGRLAEAVLRKHFELFNERGLSTLTDS